MSHEEENQVGTEVEDLSAGEQMRKMLKLLEVQQQQQMKMQEALMQQMQKLDALQTENTTLRNAAAATEGGSDPVAPNTNRDENRYQSKKPDRPTIDRDIDDREWALLMDKWGRFKTCLLYTSPSPRDS